MAIIIAPHSLDLDDTGTQAKLDRVREEMQTLGPPTIRAYWHAALGAWLALEGTHRLRVAWYADALPVVRPTARSEAALHELDRHCAIEGIDWVVDGAGKWTTLLIALATNQDFFVYADVYCYTDRELARGDA